MSLIKILSWKVLASQLTPSQQLEELIVYLFAKQLATNGYTRGATYRDKKCVISPKQNTDLTFSKEVMHKLALLFYLKPLMHKIMLLF